MPELWIPYGSVETLVTVQAENLGAVVDPQAETGVIETERLLEGMKRISALFICDASPTTAEFLRDLAPVLVSPSPVRIFSAAPRRIESAVPELKGRVTTLPPPISPTGGGTTLAQELTERGAKFIVGTPRPDPLFGIVDARVEACLNWVAHAHREASEARKEMEPSPFEKTRSKEAMDDIAEGIADASFIDIVPRGGKVRTVMEDAPFDAIKNGFLSVGVLPARAIVVGTGGRGYDDTLSSAVRTAWNALSGVRNSGSVVLIAECSEGLGSTALEMAATGRLSGDGERKREAYVDGLEDVFYLSKLRDEYDVLLLSGLPEVYAKSKLGLATARGSGEAVGRLLNKVGRSGKMNVVTRASECRIEST
ncbi:MAG: hypothetical protein ABSB53_02130 [Nitrososphaerales archaeon]